MHRLSAFLFFFRNGSFCVLFAAVVFISWTFAKKANTRQLETMQNPVKTCFSPLLCKETESVRREREREGVREREKRKEITEAETDKKNLFGLRLCIKRGIQTFEIKNWAQLARLRMRLNIDSKIQEKYWKFDIKIRLIYENQDALYNLKPREHCGKWNSLSLA